MNSPSNPPDGVGVSTSSTAGVPDAATIRAWLMQYLSHLLQVPVSEISSDDPLAAYGLDSSGAVGMAGDLGRWLGLTLDPDLAYRYPTVDALSVYLATEGLSR